MIFLPQKKQKNHFQHLYLLQNKQDSMIYFYIEKNNFVVKNKIVFSYMSLHFLSISDI